MEVYRPNYEHEDMKEYRKKTIEEPSPTPDASWLDEIKTQDGE